MHSDHRSLTDWLIVGVFALGLIAFFMLVTNKTATGHAIGTAYDSSKSCYAFDAGLPVVVTQDSMVLCADQLNKVAYFSIQVKQTTIDCQGSTIQGNGGAFLVPSRVTNPRVTLRNCTVENYQGLYSTKNPVDVYQVN